MKSSPVPILTVRAITPIVWLAMVSVGAGELSSGDFAPPLRTQFNFDFGRACILVGGVLSVAYILAAIFTSIVGRLLTGPQCPSHQGHAT